MVAWRAIGAVCVVSGLAHGQMPGVWKNHTAMENVRVVARDASTIWGGTGGGVFAIDESSRQIRQYTVADGLSTNSVSGLAVINGTVWIGGSTGSVDLLRQDGAWERISSIREAQRVQKSVRVFYGAGDTVLIGTDFGVSVYRISRRQFGDTYASFGFPTVTGVSDIVVWNNELWFATDRGVVRAERFAPNLADPSAWQRYETVAGALGSPVRAFGIVRDTLVAATAEGTAYFDGSGFQVMPGMTGRDVADMTAVGDQLYVLWNQSGGFTLDVIAGVLGSVQTIGSVPWGTASGLTRDAGGGMPWVATTFQGMARWTGSGWEYVVPNGPKANLFTDLAVDRYGVLWSASGISGSGKGFSRYNPDLPEGSRWKNYTVIENPIMGSNDYYSVGIGTGSSVWVSSWGSGVVEVAGDTIRRRLDAATTPAFSGSDETNPAYVVINGVAADAAGGTWFVNWGARNRNFLARLTGDTSLSYFTHPITGQGFFTALVIDRNGTKWLAGALPFHQSRTLSLYYFNENQTVNGTSITGGWGVMTESDGLPDNIVFSLAVDRTGSVCVGTLHGLMIISDPLYPKERRFSSFPLREQSVQAIAVDALNNKWVGTREGLFLMNPDATQILQHYTVSSTAGKLLDDDIRSLAIDDRRGIVYIGTERGLSSLSIAAVEPKSEMKDLTLGPNPFLLPSSSALEIRDLVAESMVKILRVDGSLVTEFKAQGGGRAFWDGKDREGHYVASGVYFVVAHANDGEEVATGKVAVLRK
ncbi:MAG: hypothetical protein HY563_00805 [Ignavibacteriales bacterium]|nr:hypothetical protein [Ignavibacteriales bacterium]